jgi:predicted RND superfamily exporter protein
VIVRTIDDITLGQALSLATASIMIYAILAVYFRSAWVAVIAILPNALPVLIYFGVLGLSGVTLNIITSLIACIVLGIAVDDTIHFMVRFREAAAVLQDEKKAAVEALRIVARPVASTNIALAAGFLALAVSGLRHMVEFAVLASLMLLLGWLIDMTFTPALCVDAGVTKKAGR